MAKQDQSKTTLIILVVVIVLAVAFLGYRLMAGGGAVGSPEKDVANVPKPPSDLTPVTEEEKARAPGTLDMR